MNRRDDGQWVVVIPPSALVASGFGQSDIGHFDPRDCRPGQLGFVLGLVQLAARVASRRPDLGQVVAIAVAVELQLACEDRKSTRLNSSHRL